MVRFEDRSEHRCVAKRSLNKCKDCNDTWYPRGRELSNKCPNCGSSNVGHDPTQFVVNIIATVLIVGFLGWCGNQVCGNTPTAHQSLSESRAPQTPAKDPTRATLVRTCDIWTLDENKKAVVLRQGKAGESFPVLAMNAETTGVRVDGKSAWISNSCAR